jgi:hypothetical protein
LRAITLARLICLHAPNLASIALYGMNPIEMKVKQFIGEHWKAGQEVP